MFLPFRTDTIFLYFLRKLPASSRRSQYCATTHYSIRVVRVVLVVFCGSLQATLALSRYRAHTLGVVVLAAAESTTPTLLITCRHGQLDVNAAADGCSADVVASTDPSMGHLPCIT